MADPAARRLKRDGEPELLPGTLRRGLTAADRRQVEKDLVSLLGWQRDLVRWSKPRSRVDALPYVALYAGGKLRGCFGADGGGPGERLARAFLRSLNDVRFGGIPDAARGELAAEVYFTKDARTLDPARIEATFEPGTHGLGVLRDGGAPVVLLPSVARDNGYGSRVMLDALARKAGPPSGRETYFTFEVESVVGRARSPRPSRARLGEGSLGAAAAWLARLVQEDGSVLFALDARTGAAAPAGEMHHARVAAAVQALAFHGGYPALVRRARTRLARDAARALEGHAIVAWPSEPAKVAGTLAHLVRAGVDVKRPLLAMAESPEVLRVAWHAGQVATALGKEAPPALVSACIADLSARAWAPWTVLALAELGPTMGGAPLARAVDALVTSIRTEAPHRGGVSMTPIPEVALTALTVEALRSVRATPAVRAAIERGSAFVSAWQIRADRVPAAFAPDVSAGAFVGSPIACGLRADVTAHACLALA
jgi:AMMECR1 domain-containing protein